MLKIRAHMLEIRAHVLEISSTCRMEVTSPLANHTRGTCCLPLPQVDVPMPATSWMGSIWSKETHCFIAVLYSLVPRHGDSPAPTCSIFPPQDMLHMLILQLKIHLYNAYRIRNHYCHGKCTIHLQNGLITTWYGEFTLK